MKKLACKQKIRLRKGDRVLDVGSGNNSLNIATDLLELMPDSNAQRGGDFENPADKKLHIGSIEAMPFENQSFRFVHASHVLEHTENPEAALLECMRVGQAGYIETPAAVIEHEHSWSFHHWYVWAVTKNDTNTGFPTLFFQKKRPADYQNSLSEMRMFCNCKDAKEFKRLMTVIPMSQLEPLLPYFCKMTMFPWSREIRFVRVEAGQTNSCQQNCMYAAFWQNIRIFLKRIRFIHRRFKVRRKHPTAYAQILKSSTTI